MLSENQIEAYHRDGYSFPHQALSVVITSIKQKRLGCDVRQLIQLIEKTCGRLDRIRRGRVSTGQHRTPQMRDTFES